MIQENNKKTIIGYKAFDHDFTSDGFRYDVGKTYECNNKNGFRFYEAPIEVLNFCPLIDHSGKIIRFAEVSSSEENIIDITVFGGSKFIVVTKITIEKELSLEELIQKQVEYTRFFPKQKTLDSKDKLTTAKDYAQLALSEKASYFTSSGDYTRFASSRDNTCLASSGDSIRFASSGDYTCFTLSGKYSRLASSGNNTCLASSGDSSYLASSGDVTCLVSSGDNTCLASSGSFSHLASSGDSSQLTSSGYCSRLNALGNNNRIVACGYNSSCVSQGENNVIVIVANDGKFRAAKGTHVCVATFDEDKKPTGFIVGCVGENNLKPDTLYTVRDGKFVECKA